MADSPVWDLKRMRPVVLEWEAALIAELPAYARLIPEAESRGSVLRPPATEGEIAAAEARLGVMLPPSYRSFLSIANGADAAGDSADYVTRLDARQRRGLRGIQDVGALGDELDWLVPIWLEAMSDVPHDDQLPSADEPIVVSDFEPGLHALSVTEPIQNGIVGLVPVPGEWQVWEFFHTEVIGHQSFAAYLRHRAHSARAHVVQRAERVRSALGDQSSLTEIIDDLAAEGDPRAVDVACRALQDDALTDGQKCIAALPLIWLGDPSAIPTLRAILERTRHADRSTIPTPFGADRAEVDRTQLEILSSRHWTRAVILGWSMNSSRSLPHHPHCRHGRRAI